MRLLYTYTPNTISLSTSQSSISDNEVWVLLVRHLPDTRRTGEYITMTVDPEDEWMNAGAVPSGRSPLPGGAVSRAGVEVKVVWMEPRFLHLLTCEYPGNIYYIYARTSSDQGPC